MEMVCSGDVVAACFPGEENIVLFLPFSGEVLLCLSSEWDNLKQCPSGSPSALKITLLKLGALVA
jgi:hypothetical protein